MLSALFAAVLAAVPPAALASPAAGAPPKTPPPTPSSGVQIGVSSSSGTQAAPPGAKQAEIQDLRVVAGANQAPDPWELERLGVGAVQAGQLDKARELFQMSWQAGELPTARFNLACIDARQGKTDAAFRELDRAIAAGLDDETLLKSDTDLVSLRDKPAFASVLAGARKNRAAGDAAVVKEGVFMAPAGRAKAILLVLHEAQGDPISVSGPFVGEARSRGLYLAAPRGPARAGRKRFGWGDPARAIAAVESAVAEALKRAGSLPLLIVGVGRGGTIAFTAAAITPGVAGAATAGGPIDLSLGSTPQAVAALQGKRLFAGISREAPPGLVDGVKRGAAALKGAGVAVSVVEWPGTAAGLPAEPAKAVRDILGALVGAPGAPPK